MMRIAGRLLAVLCLATAPGAVRAYDGVVEKQVFELPQFRTVGGRVIRNLRVGYETYGTLNAAGDNAILVAHYFSGNSHAAGRYAGEQKRGYWDAVIGAGKPFDTDRYFVISVDTLANLNVSDPHTVTTGPATIDAETGRPYGMRFPVVTIRDFVNVQKALADRLGIHRFAAVTGASMGAMQAMDWAAAYPDMVDTAIPVIPAGTEADPYLVATMHRWAAPIRLDPHWNGGDYYGGEPPLQGLAVALQQVTVDARSPGWARSAFGRRWADAQRNPLESLDHLYAVEQWIDEQAQARARVTDANAFLYLTRAIQLFQTAGEGMGPGRVRARVLLIPSRSDLLLHPDYARRAADRLLGQGVALDYFEIDEDGGHVDGLGAIARAGDVIRRFLDH